MKKKENKRAESKVQRAKRREQRAKGEEQRMRKCRNARMHECGTTDNNLSVTPPAPLDPLKGSSQISGELSGTVRGISPLGVRGSEGMEMKINRNSTVFKTIKPSANGIFFPAEGCISGSQAIRACLLIRIYNN